MYREPAIATLCMVLRNYLYVIYITIFRNVGEPLAGIPTNNRAEIQVSGYCCSRIFCLNIVKASVGLEPATSRLKVPCSTD